MDYLQQAKDWLEATGSQLEINTVPDHLAKEPIWEGPHGTQYRIKLRRGSDVIAFDFWGSLNDRNNRKRPSIYDVLASLDTYIEESMSLQEFGYEVNQITQAETALRELKFLSRQLKQMYSEAELNQLNEIQ